MKAEGSPAETRNAPSPRTSRRSRATDEVTGFVFKVQANMDPNHRDRIALFRWRSGRFQRGMKLKVQNTGKQLSRERARSCSSPRTASWPRTPSPAT